METEINPTEYFPETTLKEDIIIVLLGILVMFIIFILFGDSLSHQLTASITSA
jgi:hypothetical protein